MYEDDDVLTSFIETLRNYGLETAANRWYSVYRAKVTGLQDPDGIGRIKISCSVLSDLPELPEYAYPVSPFGGVGCGFFFPPRVGDTGFVAFEHGDHKYPLFFGSAWAAPKGVSEVPSEVTGTVMPLLPPPPGTPAAAPEYTTRVIKTPIGMLLRFEDGDAAGTLDKGIELSTSVASQAGGPFTKLHQLLMSDKQQMIELHSAGNPVGANRNRLVLSDVQGSAPAPGVGGPFIFLESGAGQLLALEDAPTLKRARLVSAAGRILVLDDLNQQIQLKSLNANTITIDDKTNSIVAMTIGQRMVALSDTSQTITVSDPIGNSVLIGATGIQVTSPSMVNTQAGGAITQTAGGIATTVASGIAQTSLGGAPMTTLNTGLSTGLLLGGVLSTILGLAALTLLGGMALTVVGAATITATTLSIVSTTIILGNPATAQQLVNAQILTWLATHTHPTAATGPPSVPTQAAQIMGAPAQAFLTQNVQAS